jgi:hypothetical protein
MTKVSDGVRWLNIARKTARMNASPTQPRSRKIQPYVISLNFENASHIRTI